MAKITVNADLCKGCKLCIPVCPKGLIKIGETFNAKGIKTAVQVEEERCTACKLCAIMCPDSAINVYR